MKRLLLIIIALMLSAWTMSAQSRLQVGAVFDGKVVPAKQMKETFIQGGQLQPYNLKQYRSVSLTGDDAILAEVSRRVLADAETATDQEVHYQGETSSMPSSRSRAIRATTATSVTSA